jgi:hypothetical protein
VLSRNNSGGSKERMDDETTVFQQIGLQTFETPYEVSYDAPSLRFSLSTAAR